VPTVILTDSWATLGEVAAALRDYARPHFSHGGADPGQWLTDEDYATVRVDCGRCAHYAHLAEIRPGSFAWVAGAVVEQGTATGSLARAEERRWQAAALRRRGEALAAS
jgi:hypothetical protein